MKTSTLKLLARIVTAVTGLFLIITGVQIVIGIFEKFSTNQLVTGTLDILLGTLLLYFAYYFVKSKNHYLFAFVISIIVAYLNFSLSAPIFYLCVFNAIFLGVLQFKKTKRPRRKK